MAQIRDVMTSDIKTVSPDHTAQEAAGFMLSADTGSIPVCDGDKVVGMITDRDIAVRGIGKGLGPDCKVSELMTSDVVCARDT
ncbi:MAG: CBS domain-containing protein, partial [Sphingomicrobium sp.]